jgi:GntR family carbon starvation induced transcriptional regulator
MQYLPTDAVIGSSLIDVALHKLRRAIICCELAPGSKLKVDALSRAYGLSSSPIREALNRLVQDGIVHASENKGFRVAPVCVADFREISRLRVLLECEALADAIEHGDDAWEGNAMAAFHRLGIVEKRLGAGPVALDDDWSQRHKAFHFALFGACPSMLLMNMIDSLFDRAERYRRYSALHRQTERHKSHEHQALLKLVLARDKDQALDMLRKHIQHTQLSISAILARQDGPAMCPVK